MKKLFLLFLLSSTTIIAQQKAVTEIGDEVILYENGTWIFKNPENNVVKEISVNNEKFKTPKESTFLLKSNYIDIGFWINPKKWSFKKTESEHEYSLELKTGDLYAMVITEKIEVPLKTLKNIALENGRNAAPDLVVTKEEYRIVNGNKVLFLQMDGTAQGIKFSFYGYYFSNKNGTVQFVTYTSQKLLTDFKDECKKLLNGFVLLD